MYKIEDIINKVHCADCLDFMKLMPDKCVDLVLTDPPYDKTTHAGGKFTGEIKFGNVSFTSIDIIPIVKELLRITKRWVLVFVPVESLGLIKLEYPDEYIRGGIWDRIVNSPQISGDRPAQAVEGIAILHPKGKKQWNGGGRAAMWKAMVERGHKMHETQKPIILMNKLLSDFSNKDEVIFDPFLGSGTTAVACKKLGRKFIGIEISEDYCRIANDRLRQEVLL